MADNLTLNAGSGGASLATDDIGGIHYQINKLAHGALDSATLVSTSSGLPVQQQGTWTVGLSAGTNTNEIVGDVAQDAPSAGNPVLIGGRGSTAAPTDMSADGDAVYLWTTLKGALNIADGGGLISIDDGAGSITVDGTVAATQSGTWNVGTVTTVTTVSTVSALGAGTTGPQKAEDVASADADVGIPALAVRKATPANTSGTDGDYEFLQMSAGRLWVDPSGVTLTVASHAVTNAGTFVVQENGSGLTALQKIDDPVLVDDAAFTPATSSVSMAGFQADESATDSVDEGDAGAARMTLDRKIITTPQPHTAGGLLIKTSLDLDETKLLIKGSAGQLYGWALTNTATTTRFLKLFNQASTGAVTIGTTVADLTWGIPGNTSDDVSANVMGAMGIEFTTGIVAAATTGLATADTGAPGANDVVANFFYK